MLAVVVAIVSALALLIGSQLRFQLLGECAAAALASLMVTPLTQVVDVAITRRASGQASMVGALLQCTGEWLKSPISLLQQPAFLLCWFVYLATYTSANLITLVCSELSFSPVLPKLLGVTAVNMAACTYKDARLAQIFSQSDTSAKPFPAVGYALLVLRDVLANGAGFTLPPMVAPLLSNMVAVDRQAAVAQILVPAAINTITTPIQSLALSLYNQPEYSAAQHARAVASTYLGATSFKILKGVAAYGIGGLSNTALRARFIS